jgi:hypothetical protein
MSFSLSARLGLVVSAAACAGWVSASPAPRDLDSVLALVGTRVADYYRQASNLICVERSTVQPIGWNSWTPEGMPRTVESELRVEVDAADGSTLPEARVVRDVRHINGRAPRERDKKDRTGCTDPNPMSPEPIAFLLPAHRAAYRFTSVRDGKERDRAAFVIEFESSDRTNKPQLIEDERGHDDCFDWSGPVATKGRVWVDSATFDVLRVERRTPGPVEIRVPTKLQRRYNFDNWIVLDRDEQTIRYRSVTFRDPDEIVTLPESIESMTVIRGGLQSIRRTESYSDYRRFLTAGRIIRTR